MLVVSDHTPAFEGGPLLMLSERSSVEIHALKEQGWTISAIARHTNHDRKTIRAYLAGERQPGVRVQARPDPFERFVEYWCLGAPPVLPLSTTCSCACSRR